jgi:hypothetical protein
MDKGMAAWKKHLGKVTGKRKAADKAARKSRKARRRA